jgi:type IV pilus assembly protein PilV
VNASRAIRGTKKQGGSILLEALVAILIFSVGILAIVGMQTTAVRAAGDAKFRSDASLLAGELLGQMWVSDRVAANLQTNFQGGGGTNGAAYTTWLANVTTALPGATANPPVVTVDTTVSPPRVTIQVFWLQPSEPAGTTPHNYAIVAQIQ